MDLGEGRKRDEVSVVERKRGKSKSASMCVCFVVSGWRVEMAKFPGREMDPTRPAPAGDASFLWVFSGYFLDIFWVLLGLWKGPWVPVGWWAAPISKARPAGAVCFGVVGSGDSAC